ncbi:MAG: MAPEG family protein [Pseudomonadota bacterium]
MNTALVWPMIAMVGLIAAVWARMYQVRIAEMKARRIRPQSLALSGQKAVALEKTAAADNFKNLFEVPVLFFAVCLAITASGMHSVLLVVLAWAFVALRTVHSAIQLTSNRVMNRFKVYVASTLTLFALWGAFAVALLRQG